MKIDIGYQIKEFRKERQLSIAQLSEQAKISAGLISQIERNMVSPSITTLYKITKTLGISIGSLFDEIESKNFNGVIRKDERMNILTKPNGDIFDLLTPSTNHKLDLIYITLMPGNTNDVSYSFDNPKRINHPSTQKEECGLVIKGKLKVITPDNSFALNEGDSIYLNSNIPYKLLNTGDDKCISIWANVK